MNPQRLSDEQIREKIAKLQGIVDTYLRTVRYWHE